MEPHMQIVFHDQDQSTKDEAKSQNYVEYGRRFMGIVEDARKKIAEKR
jgi:hypothetical protein